MWRQSHATAAWRSGRGRCCRCGEDSVMDVSWVELWCWWIIVFFGVEDFPVKRWTMIILNQNFVKLHPFSSQKSQPCFSGEARKQVLRADNVLFSTEQMVMLVSISRVVWNKCAKSKFQLPTVVHTKNMCMIVLYMLYLEIPWELFLKYFPIFPRVQPQMVF